LLEQSLLEQSLLEQSLLEQSLLEQSLSEQTLLEQFFLQRLAEICTFKFGAKTTYRRSRCHSRWRNCPKTRPLKQENLRLVAQSLMIHLS
jgi:hypothetical protein